MVLASLLLNIAVLIPVCFGLITDAKWAQTAWGPQTPGRSILLSIYMTISTASIALLAIPDPKSTSALLMMQILYKFITPLAVGTLKNPVVLSNIAIAVFHSVTVILTLSPRPW